MILLFINSCNILLFSFCILYIWFVSSPVSSSTFVCSLDFQLIPTSVLPEISIFFSFSTFLLFIYCPFNVTFVLAVRLSSVILFPKFGSTSNFIVTVFPAFIWFSFTSFPEISDISVLSLFGFILKLLFSKFTEPLK